MLIEHAGVPSSKTVHSTPHINGLYRITHTNPVGAVDHYTAGYSIDPLLSQDTIEGRVGACFTTSDSKFFGWADTGVTHTVVRVRPMAPPALSWSADNLAGDTWLCAPDEGSSVDMPGIIAYSTLFPFPPEDLILDLKRKTLRRFMRQIPIEVEGLSFLYELRQLAELIPQLVDSISGTIASGYLNWNFGWAPFLGDLQKVANIVDTVRARLQWLRDTWGKKTRLHYESKSFWSPPLFPHSMELGAWPASGRASRSYYRADFHAGAWLTHHLEGLNDKLAELRAIGVALGFTSPIKAVWDEIPFSFVVDWLTNVGSALDELAITNIFAGDFWVRRPVYAVSIVGRLSLEQYTSWTSIRGYFNPKKIGTANYSVYRRWSGIPEAPSLFNLDRLNPKQASLLLAIAAGSRA